MRGREERKWKKENESDEEKKKEIQGRSEVSERKGKEKKIRKTGNGKAFVGQQGEREDKEEKRRGNVRKKMRWKERKEIIELERSGREESKSVCEGGKYEGNYEKKGKGKARKDE